jgi:hypothetical protein
MFKLDEQPEVILSRLSESDQIEFAKAVVASPLKYFCPNGAQEQYINTVVRSIEDTKIPIILCTYANGVGKTTATINILLNIIYGPQNGWFDFPIFHNFPFPKLAWYCSTAPALIETVQPMFEEFINPEMRPHMDYETNKEGKQYISKMTFQNGWIIAFKTFDQEASKFESANVGIMIDDEPCPEPIWEAQKSRIRMGCLSLLPMTPLFCPPYVFDEIKDAHDKGLKGYYHLKATVYDACKQRGIRGHLDPDIVDDMVARYKPEQREARAFGEFMYFSTQIYELNKDIHFVNPDYFPIPPHSQIIQAVDPHDSRPSASGWAAVLPNKRIIVYNEYPIQQDRPYWDMSRGETIDQEVENWSKMEEKTWYIPNLRILDRHFGWQTRGQRTFAQLYSEAGRKIKKDFTFLSSYKAAGEEGEIAYGHRRVREQLELLDDGKPGLVIYNTNYHIWNGLTHYIRKRLTGKTAEDKISVDAKIVEKYKDMPDVIRYIVCSDLVARIPEKPKTQIQKMREIAMRGSSETKGRYAT